MELESFCKILGLSSPQASDHPKHVSQIGGWFASFPRTEPPVTFSWLFLFLQTLNWGSSDSDGIPDRSCSPSLIYTPLYQSWSNRATSGEWSLILLIVVTSFQTLLTLGFRIHCYLWTYFCPPLFTHTTGLRLLPLQTPWEDSEVLGFFCLSSLLVDDLITYSCSFFTWQFSTLIRAYIPHVRLPTSWSSRSTMTSVALSGSSSLTY